MEVAFLEMSNGDSVEVLKVLRYSFYGLCNGLEGAKLFFPWFKQAQAKTGEHGPSRERYSADRILRH